jgi:hypothetical protein
LIRSRVMGAEYIRREVIVVATRIVVVVIAE